MRKSLLFFFSLALISACGAEDPELGAARHAVVGGSAVVNEFESVCLVNADPPISEGDLEDPPPMICSCVLIGARTVVTSARCVAANVAPEMGEPQLGGLNVQFGAGGAEIGIASAELHRYFDAEKSGSPDLALLRLAADAPAGIEPATLGLDPIGADDVGADVVLVGYGVNDAESPTVFGNLNKVTTPITLVGERHLLAGTTDATTCAGDSGGGVFREDASGRKLIAITTFNGRTGAQGGKSARPGCDTNVQRLRVDAFADDFLLPFLRRYDDSCPADGVCAEGCSDAYGSFEDLDCDACLWTGSADGCATDCATRDWDCELGAFVGDACAADGECEEGGRCVAAVDDESFTFCTRPCDAAAASDPCPPSMTCDESANECVYFAPSPGSQGFACSDNAQCRSEVCEEGICANQCDPGVAGACPDPYFCALSDVAPGTNVCRGDSLSGGGGFCSAATASSPRSGQTGAALLLLCALALAGAWRMRRRARSL